jgi:hypothetical protein
MSDFNPSFFVILASLAGIISAKRLMEASVLEVPNFFQSIQGRIFLSALSTFFMIAFITCFIEGLVNVAWWFPFVMYFGAGIVVNFLPFMRMSPDSQVFEPAIGIILYGVLSLPLFCWFIYRWVST